MRSLINKKMTIFQNVDSLLVELFPRYKASGGDLNVLKEELEDYYSYGPYKPKITIKDGLVTIEVDSPRIVNEEKDYNNVVSLCESGNYKQAKEILNRLLKNNPTNSEYHRIYGQILSDEGEQEEAINYLIDALRWDSKNVFALIMMGNIFVRSKKDFETGRKYYDQALKIRPEDYFAMTNIGGLLLQLRKFEEATEYLEKSYAINPDYPTTLFNLSVAYREQGAPLIAFDFATECLKKTAKQESFHKSVVDFTVDLAQDYVKTDTGERVFEEYNDYLEREFKTKIQLEVDLNLPTAAKLEIAQNYNRGYHLIKYKPNYPAVAHLKMHELVHLQFIEEARREKANMLFVSGAEKRVKFLRDTEKEIIKLRREGLPEDSISTYLTALYEGINLQVYNTPIDLFIEDYLNENYKELRPYQFISLLNLLNEGQRAVTNKRAQQLAPQVIFKASKILNIVYAIQFKDLFGIDLTKDFEPLPYELKEAETMWEEFVEYRTDRNPGEEYEIVKHWGEDLKLDAYFELVDEIDFRNKPQSIEELLTSASEDPLEVEQDTNFKERETKKFLETQEEIGINQAVMWFMVDALKYFSNLPKERIKEIAFEIAMVGIRGINPSEGHSYTLKTITEKEFTGYHLLAYYYTSWSLVLPEMVSQLNLPFEKEYEMASSLFNSPQK
jgi:tetratricopeptide (TPR) repeat protein